MGFRRPPASLMAHPVSSYRISADSQFGSTPTCRFGDEGSTDLSVSGVGFGSLGLRGGQDFGVEGEGVQGLGVEDLSA